MGFSVRPEEVWAIVAHAPNPVSHRASGLEATAFALQIAALVVAIAWGVLGVVGGVLWAVLLPVAVGALWRRPGLAGGAFLVLAVLICLPMAVFVYGWADGDRAGLVVALALAVPPLVIAGLLVAAGRLRHRVRAEPVGGGTHTARVPEAERPNTFWWLLWGAAAGALLYLVAGVYSSAAKADFASLCGPFMTGDIPGSGRAGTGWVVAVGAVLLAGAAIVSWRHPHARRWLLGAFACATVGTALATWYIEPAGSATGPCMTGSAREGPLPALLFSASSLGGFAMLDPHFSDAVRYFGRASFKEPESMGIPCILNWSALGLKAAGEAHGPSYACSDSEPVTVFATSDKRWHTERGLHVGDTVARLHRLYPHAIQNPLRRPSGNRGWHLAVTLAATTFKGRVQTLILGHDLGPIPVNEWLPGGDYEHIVYS